jgi:hypothetical protein
VLQEKVHCSIAEVPFYGPHASSAAQAFCQDILFVVQHLERDEEGARSEMMPLEFSSATYVYESAITPRSSGPSDQFCKAVLVARVALALVPLDPRMR